MLHKPMDLGFDASEKAFLRRGSVQGHRGDRESAGSQLLGPACALALFAMLGLLMFTMFLSISAENTTEKSLRGSAQAEAVTEEFLARPGPGGRGPGGRDRPDRPRPHAHHHRPWRPWHLRDCAGACDACQTCVNRACIGRPCLSLSSLPSDNCSLCDRCQTCEHGVCLGESCETRCLECPTIPTCLSTQKSMLGTCLNGQCVPGSCV